MLEAEPVAKAPSPALLPRSRAVDGNSLRSRCGSPLPSPRGELHLRAHGLTVVRPLIARSAEGGRRRHHGPQCRPTGAGRSALSRGCVGGSLALAVRVAPRPPRGGVRRVVKSCPIRSERNGNGKDLYIAAGLMCHLHDVLGYICLERRNDPEISGDRSCEAQQNGASGLGVSAARRDLRVLVLGGRKLQRRSRLRYIYDPIAFGCNGSGTYAGSYLSATTEECRDSEPCHRYLDRLGRGSYRLLQRVSCFARRGGEPGRASLRTNSKLVWIRLNYAGTSPRWAQVDKEGVSLRGREPNFRCRPDRSWTCASRQSTGLGNWPRLLRVEIPLGGAGKVHETRPR